MLTVLRMLSALHVSALLPQLLAVCECGMTCSETPTQDKLRALFVSWHFGHWKGVQSCNKCNWHNQRSVCIDYGCNDASRATVMQAEQHRMHACG